jgi:2-dehydropantoate 2-reductase
MLARAGAPVIMLGRPGQRSAHLEAIARIGLRLETTTFDERVPVETATEPESVAAADLVLFCVKTVDTDVAARQIAPHVSESAIVVDLQNGVDNPERMRRAGIDPIAAVVYVAAAVDAPGKVKHRGRGDLVIGHRDRVTDVEKAATWFERASVPCRISQDIDLELWVKLMSSPGPQDRAHRGKRYREVTAVDHQVAQGPPFE